MDKNIFLHKMGTHEIFEEEEESDLKLRRYVIGCILWAIATLAKAFSAVLSEVRIGVFIVIIVIQNGILKINK